MAIRRNKFVNKMLNKFSKMSFFKKNLVLVIICLMLTTISTIGYAALNQALNISGDIALRAVKDIRISALKLINTENDGSELYNSKYTADTITVAANVPEQNSSVTYEATITNFGNVDMEIGSIMSHVNNMAIDCNISGISVEQLLEAGSTTTFTITLVKNANVVTTTEEASALIELTYQEAQTRVLTFNLSGNSIQNGTPSPNDPVDIQSVGDKTKNIINVPDFNVVGNGTVEQISEINGEIDCKGNKTVVSSNITYNNVEASGVGNLIYMNITFASGFVGNYALLYSGTNGVTVEDRILPTDTEGNITKIIIFKHSRFLSGNVEIKDIQLEIGDTSTEYEPYGLYKIPITVSGKNILPLNDYEGTIGWGTVETIKVSVKPNTVYTFSIKEFERITNIDKGNITMYIYSDASLTNLLIPLTFNNPGDTGLNTTPYKASFNSGDNSELYFKLRNNTGTATEVNINGMMVREYGTTSDYVPYVEPKTYNIYLDEPLRKIGDYSDYIDFENQQVVRTITKHVFDGTETFEYYSSSGNMFRGYLDEKYATTELSNQCLCNKYKVVKQSNRTDKTLSGAAASKNFFDFLDSDFTSLSDWKSHLAEQNTKGNPLIVVYGLETPKPPETIELPEIIKKPFYTNVSIDTEIQPSEFTYEYVVK